MGNQKKLVRGTNCSMLLGIFWNFLFCSLTLFSNNLAVVLRVVIYENVVYASACLIFSLVFKLKEQFLLYQADTSE